MRKHATTIIAPATQVSAHPIAGGGWLSLRPRGA